MLTSLLVKQWSESNCSISEKWARMTLCLWNSS